MMATLEFNEFSHIYQKDEFNMSQPRLFSLENSKIFKTTIPKIPVSSSVSIVSFHLIYHEVIFRITLSSKFQFKQGCFLDQISPERVLPVQNNKNKNCHRIQGLL